MSGGSNKAAEQAQANTEAQQASAQQAQNQITQLFNNPLRTSQYQKLGDDTTAYYTQQLDQQKAANDRNLKFAEARSGQIGGSVQVDQNAQASKDYLAGVLQAQQKGESAAAALKSQDTSSEANLIAQAQGGLNATSAATQAAESMQANLSGAQANNTSQALGNAFGDFASIYQKSSDAAALRNGQKYAYNTVYQPGFGVSAAAP